MFSGIPLPKVVADTPVGGNVLGGMQAATNFNQSQAQAQYAPQQAYANALLTTQQAQWLPYQYKMQALSNPLLWAAAANNPALMNQLTTMMQNPIAGTSLAQGTGIQPPSSSPFGNGIIGRTIDWAKNEFGKGNTSSSNPFSGSTTNPSNNGSNTGAVVNSPDPNEQYKVDPLPDNTGNNIPSPAGAGAVPDSTINRVAKGNVLSGINAATISGAQAKALDTTATQEAANQAQMWNTINTNDIKTALGSQDNINLLNKFNDSYDKLNAFERGPIAGHGPHISTAAIDADTASNALADAVARAQQHGHITETDRNTYNSMKPNRAMTPDAKQHNVDYINAMNDRIEEKPAFNIRAQNAGLTPQQASAVWLSYIKDRPFYDSKNNKIAEDNLNSWEDYLTPKKIQEALSPSVKKQNIQQSSNQVSSDHVKGNQGYISVNEGQKIVPMITPDGRKWNIPIDRLQEAINRGARQVG